MTAGMLRLTLVVLALVTAVPVSWPGMAAGAGERAPQSRAEMQLSFAPVVREAAPAVVNIYTKKHVTVRRPAMPFFDDPFFQRFFGNRFGPAMPQERVQNSLGSGVIVDGRGYVVTNNHVIDGAEEITVVLADRREFDADLVRKDSRSDLAVLRLRDVEDDLPVLPFGDSDALEVGDLVLAIGNPFGVGQTVTSGIVSALSRTVSGVSDFESFIQTDAAINPGNSGGALVTLDGRLAGINTAIYSKTGGSHGIGFAIPSNLVATVVRAAIEGTPVARPWLGVNAQPVTADLVEGVGLDRPRGALINAVHPQGPAARAGLRVGDVVLAIDGREVDDTQSLRFRLATLGIGGEAELTVLRDGRRIKIKVPLKTAPERPPRDVTVIDERNPLNGAVVANLSPALAEEIGVDSFMTGVIVLKVGRASSAARIGVRPGDIVAEINGREVATVDDLQRLLRSGNRHWRLGVRRDGQMLRVEVTG